MSFLKNSGRMLALFSLLIALAGCSVIQSNSTPAEPTQDPALLRTEVAKTVVAEITVQAALNPSTTPVAPTNTAQPTATAQPVVVSTTAPQATALQATATKKSSSVVYPTFTRTPYTDAAELVSQDPRDGFTIGPGGDFDIVWTFKNVGLRQWNTQFYIRYLKGVEGSDASKYMLSAPVNVNDTATFRVDMIAPTEPGNYVTTWQLINDDGVAIFTPYLSFTVQ